jgi:hypothetical protein
MEVWQEKSKAPIFKMTHYLKLCGKFGKRAWLGKNHRGMKTEVASWARHFRQPGSGGGLATHIVSGGRLLFQKKLSVSIFV